MKLLKYFLLSFFVLSMVDAQTTFNQEQALEMIKQRDAKWEGKLAKADSLIVSQKVVISDSDHLIKELESQIKIDSLLLLKKSEQIELLKERDEANEKMVKLIKPKWYEHKYLWFGVGLFIGKIL